MNLEYGDSLASYQDQLFERFVVVGAEIPPENKDRLENNLWVRTAEVIAPSNLVLRQLILIDLLNKNTDNKEKIIEVCDKLSYGNFSQELALWAEGYSYWLYVRGFLLAYSKLYEIIKCFINAIDQGFELTSYIFNGLTYPAPFGDLRYCHLITSTHRPLPDAGIFPVNKEQQDNIITYSIQAKPIGLNGHIPVKSRTVLVNLKTGSAYYPNGKFYEYYAGYDKKYPTFWSKTVNTISRFLNI